MNIEPSKATLRTGAFGHSRTLSYSNSNLNTNQQSSFSNKQKSKDVQLEWWDYAPVFENRKRCALQMKLIQEERWLTLSPTTPVLSIGLLHH